MLNVEEIVKKLENIEEKVINYNSTDLKKLEEELEKNWKYLHGKLNYLKKQNSIDVSEIRDLLKKIKRALEIIQKEKVKRKKVTVVHNTPKVKKIEVDLELQEIEEILESSISNEEKKEKLDEKIMVYDAKIALYNEENYFLKISKKSNRGLNLKKNRKTKKTTESESKEDNKKTKNSLERMIELKIRENKGEIFRFKEYIGICKRYRIGLTEKKINCIHQKHKVKKEIPENYFYSLILKELLEEENNVSFVQELIQINPNFLKAYEEISPICCEEKTMVSGNETGDIYSIVALRTMMLQLKYQKRRMDLTEKTAEVFAFDNKKYAFQYDQDLDFNTNLSIHVLDTSFIPAESNWCQKMESLEKVDQKDLKKMINRLTKDGMYPTFTYQLKIAPNGKILALDMFESFIKIHRSFSRDELINYRENNELKNFIGTLKKIICYSSFEEFYPSSFRIERIINYILNKELKSFMEKNQLPTLYLNRAEFKNENIERIHNKIVYYLGKIPKSEAYDLLNLLNDFQLPSSYSSIPQERSEMVLDTTTWLGYQQLCVLKAHINGFLTDTVSKNYLLLFDSYMNKSNGEKASETNILERTKRL